MNLGIIGAPGAGKDTLARYLVENKGYIRVAFADQIKDEYYLVSGYSEDKFKSRDGEEQKIRDGLWSYSAQMKERFGEDYFIKPVMSKIESSTHPTIITDIRTYEELDTCDANIKIFIVSRDANKEYINGYLAGTNLKLERIMHYPMFINDSNDLEETHQNFEKFYAQLQGDK